MTLFKLKAASPLLIEDDYNKNILPLVSEIIEDSDGCINILCSEQPMHVWQNIFKSKTVQCFGEFPQETYLSANKKIIIIIDSINQMALDMGWNECLKNIRKLQCNSNIEKLILILHRDCVLPTSKLHSHLNHISNATVTYDIENCTKVWIQIKKSGKLFKSEETLSYDAKTSTLRLTPVVKITKNTDPEPDKIKPGDLTTFKIETDQTQQLAKHNLKLPYMSKINEGQGKVYYEPDAVDDWDDEDPDDDLDI